MGLLAIDEKKLGREPQYYVSKWLYWQNYYLPEDVFIKVGISEPVLHQGVITSMENRDPNKTHQPSLF